jgi:RNA polymerase sigma-70 factor, ECF subfamily
MPPLAPDVSSALFARSSSRRARPPRSAPKAPDVEARDSAPSESALLARLRAGDEAAYEVLVRTYGPRLLAVARRYLPCQEDAEDALQSAFLQVFRFIGRFEGASRLSTWLHRIVVNSALMKIRSRRRRPETCTIAGAFEQGSVFEVAAPAVADELAEREGLDRLLRAVGDLPDAVRAAVRLRDVGGHTLAETSLLLGRLPAAAKASIHRGRTALRHMLAPRGMLAAASERAATRPPHLAAWPRARRGAPGRIRTDAPRPANLMGAL